jgi:hypothetical protein
MSSPTPEDGSFLSRWSRRKAQVQHGQSAKPGDAPLAQKPSKPDAQPAQVPVSVAGLAAGASTAPMSKQAQAQAQAQAQQQASADANASSPSPDPQAPQAPAPKPTLQDVDQLDAQSDYRSFVARDVDPEVRNAAFKKLFHSDPHFNVMDGLDVYIDDYNTPNPLPVAVMKTLVQARALGLIDDELKEQEPPVGKGLGSAQDPDGDAASDAERETQPDAAVPALTQDGVMPAAEVPPEAELVELKLVPDRASNDEPISGAAPAAATAEGTVVPFPHRPGRAGPA